MWWPGVVATDNRSSAGLASVSADSTQSPNSNWWRATTSDTRPPKRRSISPATRTCHCLPINGAPTSLVDHLWRQTNDGHYRFLTTTSHVVVWAVRQSWFFDEIVSGCMFIFVCPMQYIAWDRIQNPLRRFSLCVCVCVRMGFHGRISRKRSKIEARFQWDTNRKRHMANRIVTWPMTGKVNMMASICLNGWRYTFSYFFTWP